MSFSKDGQWIAFTRGGGPRAVKTATTEADVSKMRSDGSDIQNLTPNTPGFDGNPNFSGDGKQIVFRSGRNGSIDLYLMNADGSNVRRLTNDAANELFPVFSPTANQIAFASSRDNPKSDIFDVYLPDLDAAGSPGKIRRILNTRDSTDTFSTRMTESGSSLPRSAEASAMSNPSLPRRSCMGSCKPAASRMEP